MKNKEIEAPYELPEGWKWESLANTCDMYQPKTISTKELIENGKYLVYGANGIIGRYDKYNHEKSQLLVTCRGATCGAVNISEPYSWINGNAMVINPKNEKLDLKYLSYIFQSEVNFGKLITGSAQPQITRQSLLPVLFPLPPTLAEQQRIVNRIESMFAKLDEAKEKAQNVVDGFETRKAAILHKAFTGELKIDNGKLKDEDWEETTLGNVIKLLSGQDFKPDDYNDSENGIPYITGASNFADNHVIINRWTEKPTVIAQKNDVLLVCKGSGYGKTIIADFSEAHIARQIMALRPNKDISNRFIYYLLQNNYDYLRNGGQGLIPGIARNVVLSLPIKLPPFNYQLSIVNFLDSVLEKERIAKSATKQVLEQIDLLKKSILAKAFRGEL